MRRPASHSPRLRGDGTQAGKGSGRAASDLSPRVTPPSLPPRAANADAHAPGDAAIAGRQEPVPAAAATSWSLPGDIAAPGRVSRGSPPCPPCHHTERAPAAAGTAADPSTATGGSGRGAAAGKGFRDGFSTHAHTHTHTHTCQSALITPINRAAGARPPRGSFW